MALYHTRYEMNILCTVEEFFMSDFPKVFNIKMNPYKRRLSEDETLQLIKKHRPIGIIAGVEPLTRRVMENAPELKIISRHGVGLDSVDLEAAKEFGIKVLNTPDAPSRAVAELTIALIINLLRGICTSDTSIRKGLWERPLGAQLFGKKVGIIGCGRIGTLTAKLLEAFGTTVCGYDPYLNEHRSIKLVSFSTLISQSDIITLHIPYTIETHHIIGKNELNMMKQDAVLINAARGGIVDENALYDTLKAKRIAGAAFDCFHDEPYSGKLTELDNILLTTHIGSFSYETKLRMEKESVENLISALKDFGLMNE